MSNTGATQLGIGLAWGVFLFSAFSCDSSSPESLPPMAAGEVASSETETPDAATAETEEPAQSASELSVSTFQEMRPLAEECCTQPGDASECWMSDAERDGVLCDSGTDCESGTCNASEGRCTCNNNDECNDGVCVDGLCGPSWCNGYLVCSCWGGCEWWSANAEQTLHDLAAAQGMYCCEGLYAASPIDVDPSLGGYFTQTPCGGCSQDEDCDDNNPCTADACTDETCTHTNLTGTQDTIPDAADCPFNGAIYSLECARSRCSNGACSIELNWNEGETCNSSPGEVPAGAHTDCYSRSCAADGTCAVNISEGAGCKVGENDCSDATCDADAACVDTPLDAAGLAAHPECCDPDVSASFNDGHGCTDDFCCTPDSADATCEDITPYTDRNVPNYDESAPGNCCLDSYNCNDGNTCTQNICCGTANAGLSICGGVADDASWECVQQVVDEPGCCDAAPESLADNCNDIFSCTQDVCCTPDEIAAAVDGDPCFGASPYNCADAASWDTPPAGCCDPDEDASVYCADGNSCTIKICDSLTHQCESEPNLASGCCGPNPTDACEDVDNNACTIEECCDPITIGLAVAGDPCFGAAEWTCAVSSSTVPGCCADASDCDDGNPCTEDACVNNTCSWGALSDLSAVEGVCCTTGGTNNDSQCGDDNDANDCTQNVCCSPAMVAAAVDGDPCFEANDWSCRNPVVDDDPLPAGCCTATTYADNCNPDGNPCVVEDCVNNNCTWTANDTFAFCCDEDGDCPQPGVTRPCLEDATCSLSDNPILNSAWAQCELTYSAEDTPCGAGGDCYDEVCDDPANEDWSCSKVSYVPAGTQTCSPPNAPPCGAYYCDGSGGCDDLQTTENTYDNATCTGNSLGSAASITDTDATNVCASDDYEPVTTGLFTECGGETYSDVVYNYGDVVTDDYNLIHRVVKVTDVDGDWDPVIYARSDCADSSSQTQCNDNCTFNGSNYNDTVYTFSPLVGCDSNESKIVTGPFAVTDVPNHVVPDPVPVNEQDFDQNNVRDGFDVTRTHTTSLIVDSRYSTPDNGGTFDIEIDDEEHNNNDCRNIGSYGAAPVIDGSFQWKQRWRGATSLGDYNNYYGASGPQMGLDGTKNATDPHQAFFKLEIPAGSGKYLSYVDWNALDKRCEAGLPTPLTLDDATAGASFFHATLSEVFEDAGNSAECSSSDMNTAVNDNEWAPQLQIDATDASYENAWLAVGNYTPAQYGDYELTMLKLQPDFFGFANGYSTYGSGKGCGTMDYFDAEGYRLDFIPSGGTLNGYLMTVTNVGEGSDTCDDVNGDLSSGWDWGWLVHPRCYGPSGINSAIEYNEWLNQDEHGEFKMLPFAFPMGNDTYHYAYFDTSGRISLMQPIEELGTCSNDNQCRTGPCASGRGCFCATSLTDKKCFYDPGPIDVEPDVEEFFMHMEDGGYGPTIAGAWGSFTTDWKYSSSSYGYMTAQSVVFEGTTAFVVSWVGMESDEAANKAEAFSSTWTRSYHRPSWQVILRMDGRVVFYYRPDVNTAAFDEAVERGTFIVGLSGGISTINCSDDSECEAAYGTTTVCDSTSPSSYLIPTDRCYRMISPLVDNSDGLGNE
ncbi:MAG: hypothetical protein JXX29_07230 [Deltaproteobacteria bacterium]|nr:hypothetical protein [Deltaproteobacteria bacterium]MBN2671447.1 hypothetical protein [Deltaproteobacteria bacterium]